MAKQIMFDDAARQKMKAGIDKLARTVRVTLGPAGRNVILQKSFGAPHVTKDGVSVAKEIELKDKFENMGAQMVKEVASNTSDEAGDGTTTATVLAQAIVREGLKAVAAGANPMDIKRGIDKAVATATEELKKLSKPCKDQKAIVLPIDSSLLAEMVPTWAMAWPLTGFASFFSSWTITSTAFSMPRFSSIGLAPATTFFAPSRKMAWASTVAVVVPSPARSEVLEATSVIIWAPMFS